MSYGPDAPLTITHLTVTCGGVPYQLEGITDHHAAVYIRYRHGRLRLAIGPSVEDAVMAPDSDGIIVYADDDGTGEGCMTYAELRERLPTWITLPDAPDQNGWAE